VARFRKGHKKLGGRKRGTPNLISTDVVTAILEAAAYVGEDGRGKDGLRGYFVSLAKKRDAREFAMLLRAVIPSQMQMTIGPNMEKTDGAEEVYRDVEELRQALNMRGVHPTMLPYDPREFQEKPIANGDQTLPKPPPGWELAWRKVETPIEIDNATDPHDETDRQDIDSNCETKV
jgi:hypothetical protein